MSDGDDMVCIYGCTRLLPNDGIRIDAPGNTFSGHVEGKLTMKMVHQIRAARRGGTKLTEIAGWYGVSYSTIHNICVGRLPAYLQREAA